MICSVRLKLDGVFSAMGIHFKELEFPGGDTPWVHGLPHLRWSQGSATQVQQQAWQVTAFKMFHSLRSLLNDQQWKGF